MIKVIFFDLDGVLTTHPSGSFTTCQNLQKACPEFTFEHILSCYRRHHQQLLLGVTTHQEIWSDFCDCVGTQIDFSILTQAFCDTPKNQEIFNLCNALQSHFKLGIITDNSPDRFETLANSWSLENIFDYFVVSGQIGTRKNTPINFQCALSQAGVPANHCVFIDNNQDNLIEPTKLGMHTIFNDDKQNDINHLKQELISLGVTFP